jgi:hypothetical protein
MLYQTMIVDDRLSELHAVAAELRLERAARAGRRPTLGQAVRLRIGTALMAAGTALVSGVRPANVSRAGR